MTLQTTWEFDPPRPTTYDPTIGDAEAFRLARKIVRHTLGDREIVHDFYDELETCSICIAEIELFRRQGMVERQTLEVEIVARRRFDALPIDQ